jgi:hypothetical protein
MDKQELPLLSFARLLRRKLLLCKKSLLKLCYCSRCRYQPGFQLCTDLIIRFIRLRNCVRLVGRVGRRHTAVFRLITSVKNEILKSILYISIKQADVGN